MSYFPFECLNSKYNTYEKNYKKISFNRKAINKNTTKIHQAITAKQK